MCGTSSSTTHLRSSLPHSSFPPSLLFSSFILPLSIIGFYFQAAVSVYVSCVCVSHPIFSSIVTLFSFRCHLPLPFSSYQLKPLYIFSLFIFSLVPPSIHWTLATPFTDLFIPLFVTGKCDVCRAKSFMQNCVRWSNAMRSKLPLTDVNSSLMT